VARLRRAFARHDTFFLSCASLLETL